MKKILLIAILTIVSCSALLQSCTEEEIKVDVDNSGQTRTSGNY